MNNCEAIILLQSTGISFYNIENELDLILLMEFVLEKNYTETWKLSQKY